MRLQGIEIGAVYLSRRHNEFVLWPKLNQNNRIKSLSAALRGSYHCSQSLQRYDSDESIIII